MCCGSGVCTFRAWTVDDAVIDPACFDQVGARIGGLAGGRFLGRDDFCTVVGKHRQ